MKYLIYTILIIVLLSINMEAARLFFYTPVRVNLLVLPVIFSAVEKRDRSFLFLAFVSGLFLDFYGSAPFGTFLFSFILGASLLNWAAQAFWVHALSFKPFALFTASALVLIGILTRIFSAIFPEGGFTLFTLSFSQEFWRFILSLIFGLLAALPVYFLWRFAERLIVKLEAKRLVLK